MNVINRKTSREEFLSLLKIIEKEDPGVVDELKAHRKQLVDGCFYSAKEAGAVTSYDSIFASDDSKVDGYRNVTKAKLDPGKWLCANRLVLLSGTFNAGATPPETIDDVTFGEITDDVRQGEIEILVDRKPVVTRQPIEALIGNAMVDNDRAGIIYLNNPKMLKPDTKIEVRFWWPKALAANTCIKLGLAGTTIDSY